jgi:hypothetical protein
MKFTSIPEWTKPAMPNAIALWETIALAGLEGKWIRLSAADQRAILGRVVFGKQEFMIDADCEVVIRRSTCFGNDYEKQNYAPSVVKQALTSGKQLSPGALGYSGKYL